MRSRWLGVLGALVVVVAGCTSEATSPIDLDATTTSTATSSLEGGLPDLPEDDPNAEARNQVVELAKEECRKDPTAEFGVVVIADENGVEVNRYEHPCRDVRAEDAEGSEGNE